MNTEISEDPVYQTLKDESNKNPSLYAITKFHAFSSLKVPSYMVHIITDLDTSENDLSDLPAIRLVDHLVSEFDMGNLAWVPSVTLVPPRGYRLWTKLFWVKVK